MLRRTRPAHFDQTRIDPWPGFTDIMTGLLLILVFVITIFTITETILSRSLSQKDTELERLQRQVSLKADEIEKLKHEIDRLQELFGAQLKKATGLEEMLKRLQEQLEAAAAQINEKSALLEETREDGHVASTRTEGCTGRCAAANRGPSGKRAISGGTTREDLEPALSAQRKERNPSRKGKGPRRHESEA